MPQGSKASYSSKQKRQAKHIEDSEVSSGKSAKTAGRIAYATVNKQDGGGKKSGSGRAKTASHSAKSTPAKTKSAPRKKSASTKKASTSTVATRSRKMTSNEHRATH